MSHFSLPAKTRLVLARIDPTVLLFRPPGGRTTMATTLIIGVLLIAFATSIGFLALKERRYFDQARA